MLVLCCIFPYLVHKIFDCVFILAFATLLLSGVRFGRARIYLREGFLSGLGWSFNWYSILTSESVDSSGSDLILSNGRACGLIIAGRDGFSMYSSSDDSVEEKVGCLDLLRDFLVFFAGDLFFFLLDFVFLVYTLQPSSYTSASQGSEKMIRKC